MPGGQPNSRRSRHLGWLPFEQQCQTWLHSSPITVCVYVIVSAALIFADPNRISLVLGGLLSLFGELLRILTAGYGYKVGELALRGPYRFIRHPYFSGTTLFYLGVCVAARNPYVMVAGMVLLALAYQRSLIRDEERWRERLGPEVVDFFARVPAFLPRLWPVAASGEKRSFSLGLALMTGRHRELDAMLLIGLIYGVLYLSTLSLLSGGLGGDLFRLAIVITTVGYAILRFAHYGAIPYVRTKLHARSRLS